MLNRKGSVARCRGLAMVEFQIVALLGCLPLLLGALQMFLLLMANHIVQYAAIEAVRSGAVNGADPSAMTRALAIGLLPLHAGADERIQQGDLVPLATAAYARSLAQTRAFGRIEILSPTAADFADFASEEPTGRVIRNDALQFRPVAAGSRSGRSIQEANLLRIRVHYCHPLDVPFIRQLLLGVLGSLETDARVLSCYAAGRVPLVAEAAVNMQSDVRFHAD